MENPFKKQAGYHWREAQKWKLASRIAGIVFAIIVLSIFIC